MKKGRVKHNFNDGKLDYGQLTTRRDKNGVKTGQEFKENGHLYFDYKDIRQEDRDNFERPERTLDLKVETFFINAVIKSHKVRIGKELYNITHIDPSNDRVTMFWYLSKVGAMAC